MNDTLATPPLCGFRDRPGARECNESKGSASHTHGFLCGPNPGHTDHYGCHPFQPKATEATLPARGAIQKSAESRRIAESVEGRALVAEATFEDRDLQEMAYQSKFGCYNTDFTRNLMRKALAEIEKLRAALARATEFTLGSWDHPGGPITVAWRGDDSWAVVWRTTVLNREGEWEWEPSPSNRDDAFKERTRWPLDVALTKAQEHFAKHEVNNA